MSDHESIKRGYLEGRTGQVHYRYCGSADGIPLVLLHQSPLSGCQFDAVLPRLAARGYRVLAPDMPGFGMSDSAPEGATLEDFASIIDAVRSEWPGRPVNLVGHHTGAVLAAVFAAAHPAAVNKIVLNGFPLLGEAERRHFASFYFGPKEPKLDGSHLLIAWETRLRSTPGWTDLHLMHRYTVEALHRGETNWKAFPLVIAADLQAVLLRLEVPTLLFTNSGEDLYAATRRAYELRRDFFRYAELPGGTHDIVDEQPEPWVEIIDHFLQVP